MIDKIIHELARFKIMAQLYVVDSADFLFLMRRLNLTKGNLSSHMTRLEKAGYISVKKDFKEKKTHTMYKLTEKGKKAFDDYRQKMKKHLDDIPDM